MKFVHAMSAGVLAAAVLVPAHAAVAAPERATYTPALVAQLDRVSQSALLDPLRAAANAVDAAGRGPDKDVFAGVKLDPAYDGVDLYLTDTTAASRIIADGARLAPAFDHRLVKVFTASYTKVQEDSAADALLGQSLAKKLPYTVFGVDAKSDGSGLRADVSDVAKARSDQNAKAARVKSPAIGATAAASVATAFAPGVQGTSSAWRDVKWHDGKAFIAGDVLTNDGYNYCTAGIPAVRLSDERDIMITAGHCFATGQTVYTGGGTTGVYENGMTGATVGKVISHNTEWDMEELDQGVYNYNIPPGNNADESDTTKWIPLNGASYSYDNDYLCQDGAVSFFMGSGTPCGIQVLNQDYKGTQCDQWGCHEVRGVRGTQYQFKYALCQGDSGGLVFGISGTSRSARGITSMSFGGTTVQFYGPTICSADMFWTEAPDILKAGGLELNPLT